MFAAIQRRLLLLLLLLLLLPPPPPPPLLKDPTILQAMNFGTRFKFKVHEACSSSLPMSHYCLKLFPKAM